MKSREFFSIFSDGHERSPLLLPLKDSSEKVTSVTGVTQVAKTAEGSFYYRKEQETDLEYAQLQLLKKLNLPVPADILWNTRGHESATSSSGIPLREALRSAEVGSRDDLLHATGKTLRIVHERLNDILVPAETLSVTYENTAHIVDCFFYKYPDSEDRVSREAYRQQKLLVECDAKVDGQQFRNEMGDFVPFSDEYHPELQIMVNVANTVARSYRSDLSVYAEDEHLVIPDQTLCYGDFKAENILVDDEAKVTLIDPLLRKGSVYFDLAKFASRQLIDAAEMDSRVNLSSFFKGYGLLPTEDVRTYGPFAFSDLVCLDMLNICKSYLKRYAVGSKEYGMTANFDRPDFCLRIASHLVDAYSVKNTNQLERFLCDGNGQEMI